MKKVMMKKSVLMVAMVCMASMMSVKGWAQYDDPVIFPTMELYDSGAMNAYLRALTETASARSELFEIYAEKAFEAFEDKQWRDVISYVGKAFDTKYCNGDLYYLRGYAYEQLGKQFAAKRDYKKGKKYNSSLAAEALEELQKKPIRW